MLNKMNAFHIRVVSSNGDVFAPTFSNDVVIFGASSNQQLFIGASNGSNFLMVNQGITSTSNLVASNVRGSNATFSNLLSTSATHSNMWSSNATVSNMISSLATHSNLWTSNATVSNLSVPTSISFPPNMTISTTGTVTAASFTGSGSGLTSVSGAAVTGTLNASVIPSTVPSITHSNVWTSNATVSNLAVLTSVNFPSNMIISTTGTVTATTFTGSATGLTSLPAAAVTGTLNASVIPGTVPTISHSNVWTSNATISNLTVPTSISFPPAMSISTTGTVTASTFYGVLSGNAASATNITGTLAPAQGGTGVTTGISAIPAANVTGTLVAANIPSLDAGKITTGSLSASIGGTGVTTGITAIPAANITGTLGVAHGGTGVIASTGTVTSSLVFSDAPVFTGTVLIPSLSNNWLAASNVTVPTGGTVTGKHVGDGSSLTSLSATSVNTGTLGPSYGGTGVTTGLTVLNATNVSTGTLPVAQGGTGVITGITVLPAANVTGTLVAANIPSLDAGKITTGSLSTTLGGTGVATGLTVLNATNVTTGTLSVAQGGTGVTTGITAIPAANVTGTLGVAHGGTGVITSTGTVTSSLVFSDAPVFTGIAAIPTLSNNWLAASNVTVPTGGTVTGKHVGDGSSLTSLSATSINAGALGTTYGGTGVSTGLTVAIPTLSNYWLAASNVTVPSGGTVTGKHVGDGSSLTSLSATSINAGTLGATYGGTGVTTGITAIPAANVTGTLGIDHGGTGVTTSTGTVTSSLVFSDAPTFTGVVTIGKFSVGYPSTLYGIGTTSTVVYTFTRSGQSGIATAWDGGAIGVSYYFLHTIGGGVVSQLGSTWGFVFAISNNTLTLTSSVNTYNTNVSIMFFT